MSFATEMIACARDLIQEFGESVSIQRVAEGAYDPTDGTVAAGTTTNYSAYGAPVDYNTNEIDGNTIRINDIKLWLETPTTGEVPAIGDVVTLNSTAYRVMNVEQLRAQGSDIVYLLQLRL